MIIFDVYDNITSNKKSTTRRYRIFNNCNSVASIIVYNWWNSIIWNSNNLSLGLEEKMSEKNKMLAGEIYNANYDEELINERIKVKDKCFEYNNIKPSNIEERTKLMNEILGRHKNSFYVEPPFYCDYGNHIHFGEDVFVNINSYFMDGGEIFIGNHVFIGPSCGFYTATHPLDADRRNQGLEKALPIHIEDDVWIGANVVILPNVCIGKGSVIAAGSVVTHDIEAYSLAAGVPAEIKKKLR